MQVDSESADALDFEGSIDDVRISVNPACVRRQGRENRFFNVHTVERRLGERVYATVDANGCGGAGDEKQIAAAATGKKPQPRFEACQITDTRRCARGVQLEYQPIDIVVVRHLSRPGDFVPRTPLRRRSRGPRAPLRSGGARPWCA